MHAKEVQQVIRPVFSKWCAAHGFRLTQRGGLGWYHPVEDQYFVIGFRIPRRWNRHWGGVLECRDTANRFMELLDAHQHCWDRGADDLGVFVRFHRGMVEEVDCSAGRFLQVGLRLLEVFPLVHILSIGKIQGRGTRLATQPALSAARSLRLGGLEGDDWEQIVRSPHLKRVKKLHVAFLRSAASTWPGSWTCRSRGNSKRSTCVDRN